MDKNFVNIDNLVRQRLGGGEEQERSGSWSKMNALLDKEMPTERPGGFGWRGFFGAVAVLLFVGTVGVGGYKIATSGRDTDAQGVSGQVADASALPGASADGTQRVVATPGMEHALNTGSNTAADNRTAGANNPLATANTNSTPAAGNSNAADHTSHTSNTNNTNADHSATNNRTTSVNTNTPAGNSRANNNSATATSNEAAKHNTANPADSRTAAAHNRAADANTATAHVPAKNNRNNNANTAGAMANNNTPANNNNRGADVNVNRTPVGSSTPAGNANSAGVKTASVGNTTTTAANNTDADANVPVFVTRSGKRIPGDKLQKLNFDKAKQSEHKQTAAVAEAPKNKRVIQKMAIVERYVKSEAGDMVQKLDTVSITTLTEELGIITERQVVPPPSKKTQGEADADSKNKGMMTHGKKNGRVKHSAALGVFNSEKAEANSTNSNNANNKKSGAITLESINAAFNDVKFRMSCARFSGGITGGVNTAFFGSSSLKGFQLGLLGDMMISERVSVSGELKYFNRMSGGSEVTDNYYKYTPNANGGYTKEMLVNSYSFSTVHSFEMPLAVRFTQGKLNLFAGGNMAYSIGVNTGAVTSADPKSRTTVNQMANDNAPTISYKDFGSRLGIGYLFGASYQVSPRLSLDVRNVQTVWDNAKTSGAKAVSNQLYRNPSLQFSIGYRFGCKKKD